MLEPDSVDGASQDLGMKRLIAATASPARAHCSGGRANENSLWGLENCQVLKFDGRSNTSIVRAESYKMNSPIAIVMAAGQGTRMKSELP